MGRGRIRITFRLRRTYAQDERSEAASYNGVPGLSFDSGGPTLRMCGTRHRHNGVLGLSFDSGGPTLRMSGAGDLISVARFTGLYIRSGAGFIPPEDRWTINNHHSTINNSLLVSPAASHPCLRLGAAASSRSDRRALGQRSAHE